MLAVATKPCGVAVTAVAVRPGPRLRCVHVAPASVETSATAFAAIATRVPPCAATWVSGAVRPGGSFAAVHFAASGDVQMAGALSRAPTAMYSPAVAVTSAGVPSRPARFQVRRSVEAQDVRGPTAT